MSNANALFAAAQAHHRAGRAAEAERLYRAVLTIDARHPDALHFLGALAFQAGRLEEAAAQIADSIALKPGEPSAHINLGRALRQLGRFAEAIAAFQSALRLDPQRTSALIGLSESLAANGEPTAALDAARRAVAIDSGDAAAQFACGVALQALQQPDEAVDAYRRALALDDRHAEVHNNLGLLLVERGDVADGLKHLRQAVARDPKLSAAYKNIGKALQQLGSPDEARAAIERALELAPDDADAHVGLAVVLREIDPAAAETAVRHALTLNPDLADAHHALAALQRDRGQFDAAVASVRRAVSLAPDRPDLLITLGILANICGHQPEALQRSRQAAALAPDRVTARRNLLAISLYDAATDNAERWRMHETFGRAMAARVRNRLPPLSNDRDPHRRLRVAYVSSDFRRHPVGRNIEPILAHRDRRLFELTGYAEVGSPDAMTARLKGMMDRWTVTVGMSDEDLARRIQADGIDILVLLAGRFDRNRPQLAAWRAAPVQISLHDPATSGISGMDYLIADPVLVPRHGTERFSERVVRLPGFYVHAALAEAPPASPPPSQANGFVTFGSFNNPAKLNDAVLNLWGDVLRAVPKSRLRLRFKNWFGNEGLRRRVLEQMNISADRLEFETEEAGLEQHLGAYGRVDIALDPFPFTGSTTSFEALSMGVPVITLAGEAMVGRWTASILATLKLRQLIATSPEQYVLLAKDVAENIALRATWRTALQKQVCSSSLCNGLLRARQLERIYRTTWRRWCQGALENQ